ncbi:nucleoside triphosphate pyrophosphohydrolase [uncultured Sphingomonas sp.]|uniref:nucleoside triphosphate pyrophosphohydrolase n=1 Tax=uncultured Sphingomonas sp. TaxID=158754 RepID=UPI0035CB9868
MVERLLTIMARLRDPQHGCEWDRAQDFASIAPYTIEEAYEVADAIERGDIGDLKDELGDLLLQVVFHSRIAEEAGLFAFPDVVDAISDKLERRHPHIFGTTTDAAPGFWEAIKASERSTRPDGSALAGVALGLPALTRAEKLQRRAARTGFDWPDASGPRAKIDEELAEVADATPETLVEEVGDVLFSVVNWARHLGVDPEAALRQASAKFETRFRVMEDRSGDAFASLSLDAKEQLWAEAKRFLGSDPIPAKSAV